MVLHVHAPFQYMVKGRVCLRRETTTMLTCCYCRPEQGQHVNQAQSSFVTLLSVGLDVTTKYPAGVRQTCRFHFLGAAGVVTQKARLRADVQLGGMPESSVF